MSLLRSSAWVFGGILLGRVLGYVRELAIAGTFGVSDTTDVIQAALVIPDLMFNLLVGGAVGAALVPEFARLARPEKWGLHTGALRLLAGFLALLATVLAVFPQAILAPVASGFSPEKRAIAEPLIRIIVFVVPLTAAGECDHPGVAERGRAVCHRVAHDRGLQPRFGRWGVRRGKWGAVRVSRPGGRRWRGACLARTSG